MTGPEKFATWAPTIVEAAASGDVRVAEYVRQALAEIAHYDLPLGVKVDECLVAAIQKKLDSPNRHRTHWTILNGARARWERLIWDLVARVERCASRGALIALGRAPHCTTKQAIQVVRLVPSVREFLKDHDNTVFSAKPLHDAIKRVGLIRDDRREWLDVAPLIQDVSPIGVPITVFILRPAPVAGLFEGASRVHRQVHATACRESRPPNGRAGERATVPGVRRRRGPRAVDV